MPTVFVRRGGFTFCCLLAGLRFLTGPTAPPAFGAQYEACKFFSELPDDCAGAELRKFDNLRNYRYEEIDLFARDPLKKVLYVSTYNTTGQNGGEDSRDWRQRRSRKASTRSGWQNNSRRFRPRSVRRATGRLIGFRTGSAR